MRKLNTSDVFKMARIIKRAKVKDAMAEIFNNTRKNKAEDNVVETDETIEIRKEAAGFQAIMTIFEACCTEELEEMLYEFLGGVTEKNPEEIANQSLERTIEEIKIIVKDNNVFDFFSKADQLTN